MKVTFKKQWNGNKAGTTGSLPEKVANKLIDSGIATPVSAPAKKGKKEPASE